MISILSASFFSSFGLSALFDLPWVPLYLAICFLFHPWLGCAVLLGALALCAVTLLTESVTRDPDARTHRACRAPPAARRVGAAQRRDRQCAWHARPHGGTVERGEHRLSAPSTGDQRPFRRPRQRLAHAAPRAAVRRARARRASGHRAGSQRRRDHRGNDHHLACPRADRIGDRQLALIRRRAAKLAPPRRRARSGTRRAGARAAARTAPVAACHRTQHHAARKRGGRAARRRLYAQRRHGAGYHRAERIGQIFARPRARRNLETRARRHSPRWRDAGPMVARRARPQHRLPAAGGGAVRRHGRGKHRALRERRRSGAPDRGREDRRRARDDPAPAERLRDAGRRRRLASIRRTAPARRARPRALWRSVPRDPRRAELQPRRARRAGADRRDRRGARARRHRDRDRASSQRGTRRRSRADPERRAGMQAFGARDTILGHQAPQAQAETPPARPARHRRGGNP